MISYTHAKEKIIAVYANRNQPEYVRYFANMFWRTLILVTLLIVLCGLAYCFQLYGEVIGRIETKPRGTAAAVSLLNKTELQTIIKEFQKKQTLSADFKNNLPPEVPNPFN